MSKLATITIIGKPNVGKSTLFNAFVGKQKAITSKIAGTTRDYIISKVYFTQDRIDKSNQPFWLIDTAGLTDSDNNSLEDEIQQQIDLSLEHADLILFVIDGKQELTSDDWDIARKLRQSSAKVILVANKIDDGNILNLDLKEINKLGFGMPIVVSAKNFSKIWDLYNKLQDNLIALNISAENEPLVLPDPKKIRIAFVGRPNTGKSSLVNKLLDEKRTVVSDMIGTTRDAIDSEYEDDKGRKFTFIDTAGIRKKGQRKDMEFWSSVRTNQAIERSNICALIIDASVGVTHQDMVIAGEITKAGKGLVLCVNKFDLVPSAVPVPVEEESEEEIAKNKKFKKTDYSKKKSEYFHNKININKKIIKKEEKDKKNEKEYISIKSTDKRQNYLYYLQEKFSFIPWVPVVFLSAKTGKGIFEILDSAQGIFAECHKRVSTAELNQFVPEVYYGHIIPSVGNKRGKLKYCVQVDKAPPKFIFFVNNKNAFHFSYVRYLENKLREKYGFFGTPIIIELKDAMQYVKR